MQKEAPLFFSRTHRFARLCYVATLASVCLASGCGLKLRVGTTSAVEVTMASGELAAVQDTYKPGGWLDSTGNLYVADTYAHAIRKIDSQTGTITTVAGILNSRGTSGDGGLATSAQLRYPIQATLDRNDNIYIADVGNDVIRKVDKSTGIITTVAGQLGVSGSSGVGGLATSALLDGPTHVVVDGDGNIFISDKYNYQIKKVSVSTGIISVVAGTGVNSHTGDGGPATSAALAIVNSFALDKAGNIFLVETQGNYVRKITASTGVISTIAGTGVWGLTGNGGQATAAQLGGPASIGVDSNGDVYVGEYTKYTVRKINMSTGVINGYINTSGTFGSIGDGGLATAARISNPTGLALDKDNNLYFSDYNYGTIRKVDATTGVISRIVGNGVSTCAGTDGVQATAIGLCFAYDVW